MSSTYKKLLLAGLVAHLLAVIFSSGHFHPDEHFQILEFASMKLGKAAPAELAWEYDAKMRPALQPAMVVGVYHFMTALGLENPFWITGLLRLLSAVVSLLSVALLLRHYHPRIEDPQLRYWLVALSLLLWFAVFVHVRFSSETWSAAAFILGMGVLLPETGRDWRHYVASGLLFGLAFLFRYQTAFLVLGFGAWMLFMRRDRWAQLLLWGTAGLLVLGLGTLVDRWFYGEWVFAPYEYFYQNLVLDKAANFGLHPWYHYLTETFLQAIPPFSLVFVLALPAFWWVGWRHPLTWATIPFVLIHTYVGHKELRFLFPLVSLLPVIMVLGWQRWEEREPRLQAFRQGRWGQGLVKAFWVVNLLVLAAVCFRPAKASMGPMAEIYAAAEGPTVLIHPGKVHFYSGDLPITFYRPPQLYALPEDSICLPEGLHPEEVTYLRIYETWEDLEQRPGYKQLFVTYPCWLREFNINDWVTRTNNWQIYQLAKKPQENNLTEIR